VAVISENAGWQQTVVNHTMLF